MRCGGLGRRLLSAGSSDGLGCLFASISAPSEGRFTATIGDAWLQGATTYGGLTSALCLEGGRRLLNDSTLSVRSAMITFVGPTGSSVTVDSSVIKRGKSVGFFQSNLSGETGRLATSATFVFGKPRKAAVNRSFAAPPPALPPPLECPTFFDALGRPGPIFTKNFDARMAKQGRIEATGAEAANWLWVRHVGASDDGGIPQVAPEVALLALADMPPPALLPLLPQQGPEPTFPPVSSISWHVNFLNDELPVAAPGGWWLLESRAESAKSGYSSQDMALWGGGGGAAAAAGPVLVSRQLVAVYA